MISGGWPSQHRVWVGNLAPGLPRQALLDASHWLGLAPVDFAFFHVSGGVNSAGIFGFGTEQEAEYAVSLLHGLLNPALTGDASRPVKARRARGEGKGGGDAPVAPSAGGSGFSGGVIRWRHHAPPLQPRPPSSAPKTRPQEKKAPRRPTMEPTTPPWRKKAKTAKKTKPEHEAE